MHAKFLVPDERGEWANANTLTVGMGSTGWSIAAQIGVTKEDGLRLQIDLHVRTGHSVFQDVRCVDRIVYIGHGTSLYCVNVETLRVETHPMDGYFGRLYLTKDLDAPPDAFAVLAASASELFNFSALGELRWHASDLGIDGVIVHSAENGIIRGSGEWDPPGGWEMFCLVLATGERAAAQLPDQASGRHV